MTSVLDLINKKRQETADKRAGQKNTYRFKQKKTTIRILPGWRSADPTFYHDYGQTWIKDMDGNVLASVADASITFGEDDPVRRLIISAMGEARSDAQRAHYKEMLAKPRVLVNAQILDDKDVDPNVPEIVEFSEAQFDQILEQVQIAGIADEFLSLEEGFDLIVGKSGTGFQTKYSFVFERKPRAVDDSVMENINDIDAYIRAKFAETERAVNALKTVTQGADILSLEDKSVDYGGSDSIGSMTEAEYDAVAEAKRGIADEVEVTKVTVSDKDLSELFPE